MNASDRMPPHDIGAEMRTLGGMLLSGSRYDAVADVAGILRPDDYFRGPHQLIHAAVMRLYEAGEPVDAVTVANDLGKRGELRGELGPPYLHTLIACVPTAANAGYYARIVREKAVLRRLIETGTRIVQFGYSADGDPDEIAARARRELEDASAGAGTARPLRSAREALYDAIDSVQHGEQRGLSLPWRDLTEAISGIAPGQLIFIAARPGIGKSICGMQVAAHVAMELGRPSLLVSMEMTETEIMLRLVSAQARVPLKNLLDHDVPEEDWQRIKDVMEPIAGSKLRIDDVSSCTLARIRSRLREMAREEPAAVLVVDYVGLLEAPAKAENRQNAVAELSRDLKRMAGEFSLPVVALAQLNRSPEHRPDKRPLLSDLRDSGAQEQDADVVILLHREDAYNLESPRAGEIDFIVAKNRTGPRCTVTATFQGHYARVKDMARVVADDENWSASRWAEDA